MSHSLLVGREVNFKGFSANKHRLYIGKGNFVYHEPLWWVFYPYVTATRNRRGIKTKLRSIIIPKCIFFKFSRPAIWRNWVELLEFCTVLCIPPTLQKIEFTEALGILNLFKCSGFTHRFSQSGFSPVDVLLLLADFDYTSVNSYFILS